VKDELLHVTILRRSLQRLDTKIKLLMAARRRLQKLLNEQAALIDEDENELRVPEVQ
jgi:hypothetical protein